MCSSPVFSTETLSITMSVSSNHSTLDLYCNEATSDVVYLDSSIDNNYESEAGSNVLCGDSNVDEACLLSLLDTELDQLQEKTKSLGQLHKTTWLRNAREEAINWILKVHCLLPIPKYKALKSSNSDGDDKFFHYAGACLLQF